MSYSEFSLADLKTKFQLEFIETQALFPNLPEYSIAADVKVLLKEFVPLALAIDTEKARSELIVAPLLAKLKLNLPNVSLFSGIEFNVDSALGLVGRCDFILSKSKEQYQLDAPAVIMVEAKNDNIKSGIPQCGAEMIAARRFNIEKNNMLETIYGCVTTGSLWRFLKLHDINFYIDIDEYHIQTPERIMGIFTTILDGE